MGISLHPPDIHGSIPKAYLELDVAFWVGDFLFFENPNERQAFSSSFLNKLVQVLSQYSIKASFSP